ncbi:VOC family protein [Metabacillus litoralis]|uniref:VOC family protein n=1 Tax=Metabacillus TaxID=2675233 RepID=UPI001B9F4E00|nr:VOC family protein [Metabacillus litoralis]UHA59145.1 VOC family protein [Metabacillus litoralis]
MGFHTSPNIYVSHVHLKVSDLDHSLSFYKRMIGLSVLNKSEKIVCLTADGVKPLITIEEIDSAIANSGRKTGLYHLALLLPNRTELANVFYHLISSGYPLQGASDHLVSEAIYLADPDNNGIELYADRSQDNWKKVDGTIEMATNRLDTQSLLLEKSDVPFTNISPQTIMGHIHLQVSNIKKSEDFYRLIGFNSVNRYGLQALFISTGGYHHHIGLNTWHSAGSPSPFENELGMKSFTLLFPNEETRQSALTRLKTFGTNYTQQENDFIVSDPSNNKLIFSIEDK